MRKETNKVLSYLSGVSRDYPKSGPEDERLRGELIARAANRMFVGALLCVRECQPRHYSALATATLKYLREMIENGNAEFRVNKPRGANEFWEWAGSAEIAASHDEIARRLKAA